MPLKLSSWNMESEQGAPLNARCGEQRQESAALLLKQSDILLWSGICSRRLSETGDLDRGGWSCLIFLESEQLQSMLSSCVTTTAAHML